MMARSKLSTYGANHFRNMHKSETWTHEQSMTKEIDT